MNQTYLISALSVPQLGFFFSFTKKLALLLETARSLELCVGQSLAAPECEPVCAERGRGGCGRTQSGGIEGNEKVSCLEWKWGKEVREEEREKKEKVVAIIKTLQTPPQLSPLMAGRVSLRSAVEGRRGIPECAVALR